MSFNIGISYLKWSDILKLANEVKFSLLEIFRCALHLFKNSARVRQFKGHTIHSPELAEGFGQAPYNNNWFTPSSLLVRIRRAALQQALVAVLDLRGRHRQVGGRQEGKVPGPRLAELAPRNDLREVPRQHQENNTI